MFYVFYCIKRKLLIWIKIYKRRNYIDNVKSINNKTQKNVYIMKFLSTIKQNYDFSQCNS